MQELVEIMLDHYQLQEHLARGGMADIYLARDLRADELVAIKMVTGSASDYYERFRREVKEMAALSHKHILPVLSHGEEKSMCYLVMPYVSHGTLSQRLENGPLELEEAGKLLQQVAEALQFAHRQGVVHRDIKPSNVLLKNGSHVYLADFGLVKRVGEDNGFTLTGYLIGTPEYLAPELAAEEATPLSDLYALGIMLYQMVAGRVPFKGGVPISTFLKHIREQPAPPSQYNPTIPEMVDRVILRAIAKDPQHRFQTPLALAQAYQQAVIEASRIQDELSMLDTNARTPAITTLKRPEGIATSSVHTSDQALKVLKSVKVATALKPAPVYRSRLVASICAASIVASGLLGLTFAMGSTLSNQANGAPIQRLNVQHFQITQTPTPRVVATPTVRVVDANNNGNLQVPMQQQTTQPPDTGPSQPNPGNSNQIPSAQQQPPATVNNGNNNGNNNNNGQGNGKDKQKKK